jgi:hypothetical protein
MIGFGNLLLKSCCKAVGKCSVCLPSQSQFVVQIKGALAINELGRQGSLVLSGIEDLDYLIAD